MELRANDARAREAIAIFQVWGLLFVLLLLLDAWLIVDAPSEVETTEFDWRQGLLLGYYLAIILSALLHIASLVFIIRWMRRAYWNLQHLGRPTEHSDGWAAGAWFVPFLNMFRPYSIMREIWHQTQLAAYSQTRPHALLRWWWVVFLLQLFASNIASRMMPDGDGTPAQLRDAAWAGLLDSILGIAMALLTVQVIRRISADEAQLVLLQQVEKLGGQAPQPAAELRGDQEDY